MTTSLLLSLTLLAGPEKRPLRIDDLLALPRPGAPVVSPDGRRVAFTVARGRADGSGSDAALWLLELPGGAPRPLTFGKEVASSPSFSPDGRRLAFLSTRSGKPQPWLLDLDGGEAAPVAGLAGTPSELRFTPDGQGLLVLSDVDPACGADAACNEARDRAQETRPHVATRLLYRHWSEWRERLRTHVLRLPLGGGPAQDLTPGDRDAPPFDRGELRDVAVSGDGRDLLFTAVSDPVEAVSTNGDLYAAPLAGGPARRLTTGPGFDRAPLPSPGGRRLAWRSQAEAGYESDRWRLLLAGPDAANPRDLTAGTELSGSELWWSGPDRLLFTAEEDAATAVYQVDVQGGAPRRLHRGGHLAQLSASADGRVVVGLYDTLDHPTELALVEPGGLRVITRFAAEVMEQVVLGQVSRTTARSRDGTPVPGFVITPPGHQPGQRHPGVVLVHGGPESSWDDSWHPRWNAQLWAANGWTVIIPNFRGSPGYGMAYQRAIRGDWGGGPYEDTMAFTDAAVASGVADGERLCAAGASFGGYLVNWINGQTGRFRCLVTHAGDFNLEAAYYDTEELWFPEWHMGGTPAERAEAYLRWSPHRFAGRFRTPTLVTHGELDYRVNVAQGLSTFTALQRQGVPSRLLVFPDEDHQLKKPRNLRVFHEEAFGWVRAHIDPPAAGGAASASVERLWNSRLAMACGTWLFIAASAASAWASAAFWESLSIFASSCPCLTSSPSLTVISESTPPITGLTLTKFPVR
jgi:dipeptidyl aminopeptidase/acylaminoacyl peptidase